MRILLALILASVSLKCLAQSSSTRPPGLTIENAFYVGDSLDIIRGRIPKTDIAELKQAGITNVLIIKNQTRKEVDDEKEALRGLGYKVDGTDADILHIDYRWKDIDQDLACQQTVQILEYIRLIESTPNKKLYFHCTAGIDRTGMVSGLYRLLVEPHSTTDWIFKTELCARDYGDASPRPPDVEAAIHTELTPIYLKFARALVRDREDGFLKGDLKNICNPEFYKSAEIEAFVKDVLPRYKCQ